MSSLPVKAWICPRCGYIHYGPQPPDECPVCGTEYVLSKKPGVKEIMQFLEGVTLQD
jgi:primosomal protein N'